MESTDREVPIVLLAGGRSRRMGTDKAYVEIGGREILDSLLRANLREFFRVVLVTNDEESAAAALRRYGWRAAGGGTFSQRSGRVRIVRDERPHRGPLGGIEAGLRAAGGDLAWVLACDLPLVVPGAGRRLIRALREAPSADVALPRVADRRQPLCAAYRVPAALEAATSCLDADIRRVEAFVARLELVELREEAFRDLGDPDWLFFNVNRPRELRAVRARLAERG